jgi:cell division protease FtsH
LFELERAGIVFFDDVDMALRQRGPFEQAAEQSTFLAGLDGLDVNHGVVYLFTTNARLEELDAAFRRPGRIDLVLHFARPDAHLRRRLIEDCWDRRLAASLNVDRAVAQTAALSFAEMEEIKKLLVLRYLERGVFDWDGALGAFRVGRGACDVRPRIGFHREPIMAFVGSNA